MITVIVIVASVTAATAGVRSTWSPCGLSMLSTITPLAEQGRGHRYRATASWFVIGASLGGATLGVPAAALALAVRALHLGAGSVGVIAVAALLVAAASDRELGGFHLPVHHRQVNERWLDQFRPWVYGAGFGWQIGTGLATYIMTAAVYVVIVLGALTALPVAALSLCTLFGAVRGLCVLLGASLDSPATLQAFHRRLDALAPAARDVMVAVELVSAAAVIGAAGLPTAVWAATGGVGIAAALIGAAPLARLALLAMFGRARQGGRDRRPGQRRAAAIPRIPASSASRPVGSRAP
jgi:hypothetical protein